MPKTPHDSVANDGWLTKAEAAERLGVSTRTIERLIALSTPAGKRPHARRSSSTTDTVYILFMSPLERFHDSGARLALSLGSGSPRLIMVSKNAARRPKVIMQVLAVLVAVTMVGLLFGLRHLVLGRDSNRPRSYRVYVCRFVENQSGGDLKDGSDKSSDSQAVVGVPGSSCNSLEEWPTELELGFGTTVSRAVESSASKSAKLVSRQ